MNNIILNWFLVGISTIDIVILYILINLRICISNSRENSLGYTNFLSDVMQKKGSMINKTFELMIGVVIVIFLLLNFLIPTLNTASATGNLTIMGTSYDWVLPLIVILVILAIIIMIYEYTKAGKH
jgi:hypothetical protein